MSRLLTEIEQVNYACYVVAIEQGCYLDCFKWEDMPWMTRNMFLDTERTFQELLNIRERYASACKCACQCKRNRGRICPDPLCETMSVVVPCNNWDWWQRVK